MWQRGKAHWRGSRRAGWSQGSGVKVEVRVPVRGARCIFGHAAFGGKRGTRPEYLRCDGATGEENTLSVRTVISLGSVNSVKFVLFPSQKEARDVCLLTMQFGLVSHPPMRYTKAKAAPPPPRIRQAPPSGTWGNGTARNRLNRLALVRLGPAQNVIPPAADPPPSSSLRSTSFLLREPEERAMTSTSFKSSSRRHVLNPPSAASPSPRNRARSS